jgi:poly(beta-D-mannuronate) C5 epimerase
LIRRTACAVAMLAVGLVPSLAGVVAPAPAFAAACTSPVRYAVSTNTIYLVARQSYTLSSIIKACPSVPLVEVDPVRRVWQLNADLVLQNGGTLVLHGAAAGGDVDTLRLRSLASNKATEVSQLAADYGTLDIKSTKVTSWDGAANGPDTNATLPAGSAAGSRGRAFIRVLSTLAADGATVQESRMDIVDSEVSYLGYYAAESYGVTYKSRACARTDLASCAKVKVSGSQINSSFHHNYMGTFTWGARDMAFRGSRYENNISYGLDPHDVSSNLTIDRNTFAYNGNHGLICSQRCDRLTITNNASHDNGLKPWRGPNDDADIAGQVHGIMLHRGITNTVISDNRVWNQPSGAGIVIFDSVGNTVTRNQLDNNMIGIRLSVGAARNTISNNVVRHSAQYALLLYKGGDIASYSTASSRPTNNVFDANTLDSSGVNAVKFTESDGNQVTNSTVTGTPGPLVFDNSTGTKLDAVRLPAGQAIVLTKSTLTIANPNADMRITIDPQSTVDVTSRRGTTFATGAGGPATTVTPTGSTLRLTPATVGTAPVTVTPQRFAVLPSTGTAAATATGTLDVRISGQAANAPISFTVSGLRPGSQHTIRRGTKVLTVATADAAGQVKFTDSPPSSAGYNYQVV